ncbi:hypothetical protein HMPREF1022_00129 [Desulfovibrio sp. 6_1_46AFAA]|nr:hypothetical protein HMPREF1022_00129 [Desulfovibrio sp. 6_1_46AFAA]
MSNQFYAAASLIVAVVFLCLGCSALWVRRRIPARQSATQQKFAVFALYSFCMVILNVLLACFTLWG